MTHPFRIWAKEFDAGQRAAEALRLERQAAELVMIAYKIKEPAKRHRAVKVGRTCLAMVRALRGERARRSWRQGKTLVAVR